MHKRYLVLLLSVATIYSCKSLKSDRIHNTTIILNKGIGGNTTADLLARIDNDVLNEGPDLVVLMVGTNDFLNSKKMISYENYTDNLDAIVKKIKANNAQVLLLSPPPVDSSYLFLRHDKRLYKEAPNIKMNRARQIVEQIAKDHQTLYVNIYGRFRDKGLPIHNEDLYIRNIKNSNAKDGVHPTPLGYKFIAETIFQYLKENKLLGLYHKVICFGDSITLGSGAQGAGTIYGENYPSFLNTMILNL
jgi:lysophospholipase L1-like esterase